MLCPNETSVNQWAAQFQAFSTVPVVLIRRLTARCKEELPPPSEACVLLTTYSMISMRDQTRAALDTQLILRQTVAREWGLMILDETHQVVADTFRKALHLPAHCRLGLTATLVREDGRDRELVQLIGPKLYEANWMDLTKSGFLANVQVRPRS